MKKVLSILLVLAMALGMFAFVGCSSNEAEGEGWAYIEDKGELIVGLDDTFAPMGFRDEAGELVGFDIDLATAVCEELGINVKFQPIEWDAKEMELEAKNIDCIWNGMSATAERQESMSLTDMYLNNCIIVMSLDSSINITSEDDLANYQIGTQADSASLEVMMASEKWDTYADNVAEFPTFDEAIMALQGDRVDVIVVDQVLGEYKNSKLHEPLFTCDFTFGDDFYAIGCRKADKDVAAKLTEAIGALIDSGEAAEISEKWFGKDIVILKGYDK